MKILAVGNSFSDDTMEYVYRIARSAGEGELSLGNLYIGGCSLETHAANARANAAAYEYRTDDAGEWHTQPQFRLGDALSAQEWDVISLQQASPLSGQPQSYEPFLSELIAYVRERAPQAKLVWNMTWAYQADFASETFAPYGYNQRRMYENILAAVKEKVLPHPEFSAAAPCGTAVQNARTSFLGDALTRDGFHLSYGVGRYIAGLTFAKTVLGVSPERVSFVPAGVDEAERAVAAEAAKNACAQPFAVTPSVYRERP